MRTGEIGIISGTKEGELSSGDAAVLPRLNPTVTEQHLWRMVSGMDVKVKKKGEGREGETKQSGSFGIKNEGSPERENHRFREKDRWRRGTQPTNQEGGSGVSEEKEYLYPLSILIKEKKEKGGQDLGVRFGTRRQERRRNNFTGGEGSRTKIRIWILGGKGGSVKNMEVEKKDRRKGALREGNRRTEGERSLGF